MKALPVIDPKSKEKREMFERISLKNRPRLNVNLNHLDEVAASLASSDQDRERFLENPVGYLKDRNIEVASANLTRPQVARTSEACTAVAICNIAIAVNVTVGLTVLLELYLAVQAYVDCFNRVDGCWEPTRPKGSNMMDPASPVWL